MGLLRIWGFANPVNRSVSKFACPYVLRCSDGKLYVGSTTDLKRRIKEHEGGLVPAASYRLPAKLVYYEACQSQSKRLSEKFSSRPDLAAA